ncbi:hypothetical protein INR49_010143 [Caranx melampygus]|nr:hypothetical protein INR49_010143 [Caranx melampygus]
MAAPQLLQRPVMLATKLSSSLPSAAPIHQVRIVNGQPCSKTGSAPLTGIVITTPVSAAPTRLGSPAQTPTQTPTPTPTPAQPIQISTSSSSTPPLSPAPRAKKEENPEVLVCGPWSRFWSVAFRTQTGPWSRFWSVAFKDPDWPLVQVLKLAFMVSLGLVTHDHLEEIQSKRQERKRRTTANPVYSGAVFEPERKKSAVSYLNSPLHQGTRKRGPYERLVQVQSQ